MNTIKTAIKHIYSGKVEDINDRKRKLYPSAYRKQPMPPHKRLFVNSMGFIDDMQGDTINHGGADKAVCVYSQKYYDFFKNIHHLDLPECAFGENLTILDLDDSDVCIGDQFKCGEVIFEVSQPRQPCWKISSIIGIKNLTSLVVKEHKTGFYLREDLCPPMTLWNYYQEITPNSRSSLSINVPLTPKKIKKISKRYWHVKN